MTGDSRYVALDKPEFLPDEFAVVDTATGLAVCRCASMENAREAALIWNAKEEGQG